MRVAIGIAATATALAIMALVVILALAAFGVPFDFPLGGPEAAGPAVGRGAELAATVTALPPAPLERRRDPVSVWTGRELLVWGGGTPWAQYADGAAYEPDAGTWRMLAPAPLAARDGHVAVWTGSEMLVWGGGPDVDDEVKEPPSPFGDGAAYDPSADAWRLLPPSPPDRAVRDAQAVWAAGRMVVVGGHTPWGSGTGVTLFRPETGTWSKVDVPGSFMGLATDGTLVAVLVTAAGADDLALVWLDPVSGTFGPPIGTGLTSGLDRLALAWAGDRFVVMAAPFDGPAQVLTYRPGAHRPEGILDVREGDLVAPRVLPWAMDDDGIQAWTGHRLLTLTQDGAAAYDPTARTLSPVPSQGLDDGGLRCAYGSTHAARAWTGGAVLVWGGMGCTAEGRAPVAYGYRVALGD